jgi:PAS domain S-box-containing protein
MSLHEDLERAKRTMWQMMNYLNLYVVVLDKNVNIVLANRYLIFGLGYENEDEVVGRCWYDFIPTTQHQVIANIHSGVLQNDSRYIEVVTEIISKKSEVIPVRWFNSPVNHNTIMTFSIGIPLQNNITAETSTKSIRAYFRDIIQKDKTFITAMRDVARREAHECAAFDIGNDLDTMRARALEGENT